MKTIFAIWVLIASALLTGAAYASCDEQAFYIDPEQVDLVHVLGPPPPKDSAADKEDAQAVLTAQRLRTTSEIDFARADVERSIFRFNDVLGADFKSENLPITTAFFQRAFCDEDRAIEAAKKYFQRPRPFVSHANIKPIIAQPANASYPSGHSTFGYAQAILLAAMIPEKTEALFQRADQYAHNRIVAGVHYPTDIAAGRISAAVIDNVLLHNQRFMADFEKSRVEIRKVLKLDNR